MANQLLLNLGCCGSGPPATVRGPESSSGYVLPTCTEDRSEYYQRRQESEEREEQAEGVEREEQSTTSRARTHSPPTRDILINTPTMERPIPVQRSAWCLTQQGSPGVSAAVIALPSLSCHSEQQLFLLARSLSLAVSGRACYR